MLCMQLMYCEGRIHTIILYDLCILVIEVFIIKVYLTRKPTPTCMCNVFHNRVHHVWSNIKPGYTCRTTVTFGTVKDGIR